MGKPASIDINPSGASADNAVNLMNRRAGRQRGFTLLEIIIALSLTALLLSMLTAGVYGVVRDWDDNAERLDGSLEQTIAMLQLERALLGAFPHGYRDQATLARYVFFDGQPDELSWVSSLSPQRESGLTAWRLSNSAEGILLQLAPALSDNPELRLTAAGPRLLLPGYVARFQYLYEDLNFQRVWRDTWPGRDFAILPMAVHIRIESGESRATPVIDIVAPLSAREHRNIRPNLELIR